MMQRLLLRGGMACVVMAGTLPAVARAQRSNVGNEVLDAMRAQASIGELDQERIADWQRREVDALAEAENATAAFKAFRERMGAQFNHSSNSREFSRQFAVQAAGVAQEKFSDRNLGETVASALARILVDMARPETIPGLVAGLNSTSQSARYLCAKGLADQKSAIAADNALLASVTKALREAGIRETNATVLSRVYLALGHSDHIGVVFDAFTDLFDQRLAHRRGPALVADGAEIDAFEFFARSTVLTALSNEQKTQLVARIAVFLRLDAERYDTEILTFDELTKLEYSLSLGEKILAQLSDSSKILISKALEEGGHNNRKRVLKEAYGWVGNPKTNEKGFLNETPWDLPVGAP